ncbi:Uncharacterized protein HZ326_3974 [Fusarium oxysporum f. sp. albedinis]|nr:Uncharacterized protein HZ326_3974 [Fusarium oxysporum f. sp. albedinis]
MTTSIVIQNKALCEASNNTQTLLDKSSPEDGSRAKSLSVRDGIPPFHLALCFYGTSLMPSRLFSFAALGPDSIIKA